MRVLNYHIIEDFVKSNYKHSKKYFEGRVREADRELAEVQIAFRLGNVVLNVKRDFLNPGQVIQWYTQPIDSNQQGFEGNSSGYEDAVAGLSGLEFNQFCFLCHYLLNFDENRLLLFWNSDILTRTLFLVFGLDPQMAIEADTIARQIDRVDSRVRNLQWDITKTRTYLKNLQQDLVELTGNQVDELSDELSNSYQDLISELDNCKRSMVDYRQRLNLLSARIAEMTAHKFSLKNKYELEYANLFKKDRSSFIKDNPIIREIHSACRCGLCGSEEQHVVESVRFVNLTFLLKVTELAQKL